jgi:hypothetical protein
MLRGLLIWMGFYTGLFPRPMKEPKLDKGSEGQSQPIRVSEVDRSEEMGPVAGTFKERAEAGKPPFT